MRYFLLIALMIIVLSSCSQPSHRPKVTLLPASSRAPSIKRLNDAELAVFVSKAIAVMETGRYSQTGVDGSVRDHILIRGYDKTIAPKHRQSSDGSRIYVTLTHSLSQSGLSGTLVHFEFDVRTEEIANATTETFVSDTF